MSWRATATKRFEQGMTIVEIAIGIAVLGLLAATALTSITTLNRNAFVSRVMSNAREVVQSNIETAIGSSFSTNGIIPAIFVLGTSSSSVVVYTDRNGDASQTINGTLTRTTSAESNSLGADVRRVQYSVAYTVFNRSQSYTMTTLKASDQ